VEEVAGVRLWPWSKLVNHKTAIFRQLNQKNPRTHHDALEFSDGQIVLLTFMAAGCASYGSPVICNRGWV
jgi:hypothetical protein